MEVINRIDTNSRMSRIVVHRDIVYLCGQTVNGKNVIGVQAQTAVILSQIDELLARVGSDRSKLLSVNIHLKSMNDFAEMNRVWESWLPQGSAPARTTVEAKLANENLLVEFSVIAAK